MSTRRPTLPPWSLMAAGLILLVAASLATGVSPLAWTRVADGGEATLLLLTSRLPRTLAALLCGAGLAVAGLVMQILARNRFVEPTTAGTGESAALGILLVTLLFPAASIGLKALAATLVALAGTAVFLALVRRLPPTQPFLVPLVGLVYGGLIGAMMAAVAWQTDLLQYIEVWTSGEFSGVLAGRYEILWLAGAAAAAAYFAADRLTILSLGRDVSVGLGLSYETWLRFGLLLVSVVTAVVVTVVGLVPFVGLVVPNLVTRMMGDRLRGTIPVVAWGGATLVLACDLVGRSIRHPYEIPVGVILGVVGAALFIALVLRRPADV